MVAAVRIYMSKNACTVELNPPETIYTFIPNSSSLVGAQAI